MRTMRSRATVALSMEGRASAGMSVCPTCLVELTIPRKPPPPFWEHRSTVARSICAPKSLDGVLGEQAAGGDGVGHPLDGEGEGGPAHRHAVGLGPGPDGG